MSIAGNENSDIIPQPVDRAPREGFSVSAQDILRRNPATIPICPDCREPMVFKARPVGHQFATILVTKSFAACSPLQRPRKHRFKFFNRVRNYLQRGEFATRVVLSTWGWGHGVGVGESVRKQGNRVHSRRGDHRKPKGKGRDASTGFVVEALSEIHARCRQAAAIRFSASSLN